MEKSTQTEEMSIVELSKSINLKLDEIHSVLGYILEKTNLIPIKIPHKGVDNGFKTITVPPEPIDEGEQTDDNLDARDAEGTVLN